MLTFVGSQEKSTRMFDSEMMDAYASQEAFNYMNYTVRPPSIWERLSWWFQSMIERIFLNPNTPWLTRILYYMVILLVVGAAIFYIIKLRYGKGLTSDYSSHQLGIKSIENTKAEDFENLIDEALSNNNYKLAIRYLYLKTLSSLSKKHLISLKDWKSPYDYQRELKGDTATCYAEIARLFEYVWYGDFDANKEDFDEGSKLSHKLEVAA